MSYVQFMSSTLYFAFEPDPCIRILGFPGASDGKESVCNARDPDSIPALGRSTGERNGHPL